MMSRSVLVIDVGGTSVKFLASGQKQPQKFPSGPKLTPKQMVVGVREAAKDWKYDTVSIGYPGPVVKGRIMKDPHNLGRGWKGFDFKAAFKRPVKIMNDAGMQALGSYRTGTMLFLGFGTGLGSALVVEGVVVPMELAHLSYRNGTYEDYLGLRGLKRLGKRKWRKHVAYCVTRLIAALYVDDVVLGGGNRQKTGRPTRALPHRHQCERVPRWFSPLGENSLGFDVLFTKDFVQFLDGRAVAHTQTETGAAGLVVASISSLQRRARIAPLRKELGFHPTNQHGCNHHGRASETSGRRSAQ
jgi:predicted NBD/HSP70 family sugar kinase